MATMTIQYFGTSLTSAGHYFWSVTQDGLRRSHLQFSEIPFDPEDLPNEKGEWRQDGYVNFYSIGGYSICNIYGSCIDKRRGCKSVFFVKEDITNDHLCEKMLSFPVVIEMLKQMPFAIKHPILNQQNPTQS